MFICLLSFFTPTVRFRQINSHNFLRINKFNLRNRLRKSCSESRSIMILSLKIRSISSLKYRRMVLMREHATIILFCNLREFIYTQKLKILDLSKNFE